MIWNYLIRIYQNLKFILNNMFYTKEELNEKCWVGYTKKGMKTMYGKKYPNCVKNTKK